MAGAIEKMDGAFDETEDKKDEDDSKDGVPLTKKIKIEKD
ncbi:hypothetical protein CCACVL1_28203 [Corchorus capsularis]|uniref:Uncharacterized protein n=1 Tax=Corchorus capsularis TaxID=210143 RepID=A0A1R3G780_COCAP|nr:hypothetical protein CCACVL1_28203 [Corchorus capsularis]